jgi:hypothetical protein
LKIASRPESEGKKIVVILPTPARVSGYLTTELFMEEGNP